MLVRQFRVGSASVCVEIPGGMVDPGEDPATAAARELAEETGYASSAWSLLGTSRPNPAIQNNRCHLVLVEEAVRSAEQDWDTDEEIAVSTAPVAEVLAAARGGRITHALVLNALFCFEPFWAGLNRGGSV